MTEDVQSYALDFPGEPWSEQDRFLLEPFATNLDGHIHVLRNLPPEIVGALCSRASRAKDSLLRVLLKEYFYPILEGEDKQLAAELEETVRFMRERGFKNILNNSRAQAFYAKWLSQYGDDSIAQMTGTHVLFWGISQVAMKFIEDQRVGLEPIEKSTRYVNFSNKIGPPSGEAGPPGGEAGGKYLYYTPAPDLERLGLLAQYRAAMDHLFDTYVELLPKLMEWLKANFSEKESILEKKAFDTLRGLLPMATLGQVAFRGNAQAWEYLVNRLAKHGLGEFRWLSQAVKTELDHEIPSLLLRVSDPKSQEYQEYLAEKRTAVRRFLYQTGEREAFLDRASAPQVRLVEFDPHAEDKIIAGILFSQSNLGWERAFMTAVQLSPVEKREILKKYAGGRKARWFKAGRALENSYLRFEIVMNIGAYRDLHRHRMMTQERQLFTTVHGYDVPSELREAGLDGTFADALERAAELFRKIEPVEPELAQYVVPLAYRVRFYQWQNLRQFFWETELRTISQGHPDYRVIEQAKYRIVKEKFPLLAEYLQVDMNDYAVARRGTEEKIAAKEKEIIEKLGQKSA